jgi:hypothetical protein
LRPWQRGGRDREHPLDDTDQEDANDLYGVGTDRSGAGECSFDRRLHDVAHIPADFFGCFNDALNCMAGNHANVSTNLSRASNCAFHGMMTYRTYAMM